MGGGDKELKESSKQALRETTEKQREFRSEQEQIRNEYRERSDAEREAIKTNIEGSLNTQGGLDPTVINNIRNLYGGKNVGMDGDSGSSGGGGGGGGGGGDSGGGGGGGGTPQGGLFDTPQRLYEEYSKTGAIEIEKLREGVAKLEEMAKTGAYDPDAKAQIEATIAELRAHQFDPAAKAQIERTIASLEQMGQTGGYDPNELAKIRGDIDSIRQWSQTGGLDADRLAKMREGVDFLSGGGISEEDLARWRGTGYGEFAETGGYSDAQRRDIRDRATSAIPALYAQQMADASRLQNIGGGNAGSFLAAAGRLNRQRAQDLVTASRNAEIDLGSQIREGRRWGIEGLAGTERDIQAQQGLNRAQGLGTGTQFELGVGRQRLEALGEAAEAGTNLNQNIAQNRISATEAAGQLNNDFQKSVNDAFLRSREGAGSLQTNMANAISQNRIRAQEAAATAEATAQKLRQEGQLAAAQGLLSIAAQKQAAADRAAATGAAARANEQANERWWANFQAENEQFIGTQQQRGEQIARQDYIQLYGMDPTLDRDRFGLDIDNSIARNAALARESAGGGVDWAKWASLGISGAGTAAKYSGGKTTEQEEKQSGDRSQYPPIDTY